MTVNSRYWAEWTTQEFARSRDDGSLAQTIAVLPLGATEQHGPHLPLRVDTALVDGVVAAAVVQLRAEVSALFLPTQPVGYSPEHAAFHGTLTLKPETTLRLWTDIAESAVASGIRKLVLFNAHGGHTGMMDVVARDLRARLGVLVYSVSWFHLPLTGEAGEDVNARFSAHEHRFGVHAGDIETSMMLALAPQEVQMQWAQNFHSSSQDRAKDFPMVGNGKSAKLAWQMQDYNPAGAAGNAAAATAEKGRAIVDAAGRSLAQLLSEVHRLPAQTLQKKPTF
jgi:creatinine amidohydrolase